MLNYSFVACFQSISCTVTCEMHAAVVSVSADVVDALTRTNSTKSVAFTVLVICHFRNKAYTQHHCCSSTFVRFKISMVSEVSRAI